MKSIMLDENGMGTLEIVIIAAVLVGIALIFRKQIFAVFSDMIGQLTEAVESENLVQP